MSILLTSIASVYLVGVTAWVGGALFYDVAQRSKWGWCLVPIWLALVVASVFFFELRYTLLLITTLLGILLVWWFSQRPSNDRDWSPNFSRLCKIQIDEDNVTVKNVRNTQYRSQDDYDAHYETREYRLSDLHAAEVLILYWGSPWICHPMVIFDFGQDQHLCFSVEVRYRQGQPYDILRSLYRQYELMYVVSDERDAILLRTKYSENHDCYLYRLQIDVPTVRQLFFEYVEATNQLLDSPKWYHAIANNCITAIVNQRSERVDFDSRLIFNGFLDKLLYDRGRLSQQLPFEELKKISRINDTANLASKSEFHRAIRQQLPGFESRNIASASKPPAN